MMSESEVFFGGDFWGVRKVLGVSPTSPRGLKRDPLQARISPMHLHQDAITSKIIVRLGHRGIAIELYFRLW